MHDALLGRVRGVVVVILLSRVWGRGIVLPTALYLEFGIVAVLWSSTSWMCGGDGVSVVRNQGLKHVHERCD
ncbi:hypothetical protein XFPR_10660 [Xylella fastidiosa]|uniref:hypothetical protein n=1 Tax=Xylella fastidiosa TaxID=2371 RepID=UPI00040E6D7B|nr:hypothetical protein [Xylella fastidiosa]ALR05015.2 hypothetical protein XFPR_10660 [Xylella fastidiosa]